jgi:signal peptide peptidase SppA
MKRSLLLAEFMSQIWALHPAALTKFSGVMMRWAAGILPSAEVMGAIAGDKEARAARQQKVAAASSGSIAVLPLYGIITQRGNMADDVSGPGSCSLQQFSGAYQQALADPSVAQILIDIDSPGGSVYGVDELADTIYGARGQKPVIGIANSLCASAAYYIGSACSELYCTPSGEVGSIGVYTAHQDISKMLAEDGINVELISAGKYKTEGNPYGPLTDEARAAIQQSVNGYYNMFTKAVARGRGVPVAQVRDGMGQGRCLSASDALAQNMVDGVMSFDDVVAKMQKSMRTQRGQQAEVITPEVVADAAPAVSGQTQARRRALQLM